MTKVQNYIFILILIVVTIDFGVFVGSPASMLSKALRIAALLLGLATVIKIKRGVFTIPRISIRSGAAFMFLYVFTVMAGQIRSSSAIRSTYGIIADVILFGLILIVFSLFYGYYFSSFSKFKINFRQALDWVLAASMLFLLINLAYFLLKPELKYSLESDSIILKALGFDRAKINFPLAGGHPGTFGQISGTLFATMFAYFWYLPKQKSRKRVYLIIGLSIALVSMVMADSRGVLLNTFLTIGVIMLLRFFRLLNGLKYLVYVLPVAQFALLGFFSFLSTSTSAVSELSRDKNDLATGNSRMFVYQCYMEEFAEFKTVHLIGYGDGGAYKSGIADCYAHRFHHKDEVKKYQIPAHNAVFEALTINGYLGVLAFLIMVYFALRNLGIMYSNQNIEAIVVLHPVLYFVLSGILESTYGLSHSNTVISFIFIVMSFFAFNTWIYTVQEERREAEEEKLNTY